MKTHYTIPFFIPHHGCPHQCVFCNQKRITGFDDVNPEHIIKKVEKYLSTIPETAERIEVGFFGGSFTGLPLNEQENYLKCVQSFWNEKRIHGIRLSTRPDFINEERLDFLKRYNVSRIELGVQSMSDKVLQVSKRGHTAKDVEIASQLIIENEFMLGHQMMIGLPESTWEDEFYTARRIKELGASEVRIYPVLVIKNTELADMYSSGNYMPLDEDTALLRSAKLIEYFKSNNIKVIRCGLHPSEELLNGSGFLAGPFHPSFRQKAEARIENL